MIPIRNKRKTLQVTVDEMRNFALAYVEKYAPSKQQLRTYLLKNGKIKSITGDKIILDTPSNNKSFSKQDDTADKVSKMASQSAKSSIDN